MTYMFIVYKEYIMFIVYTWNLIFLYRNIYAYCIYMEPHIYYYILFVTSYIAGHLDVIG